MNKNSSITYNLGACLLFRATNGLYLVKPENFKKITSLKQRLVAALGVFSGRFCAVSWDTSNNYTGKDRTKYNMCKNENCPNGRREGSSYCQSCSDTKKV